MPQRRSITVLTAAILSCSPPPIDRGADEGHPNHNQPLGRIEGTIVYQGPAPPTSSTGRALGRVVLLLFATNNPPPPRGLASSAESLQTIPASVLFANATRLPGGSVRATAPFTFGSIARPDYYQLRGFYSAREETTAQAADLRPRPTGFQPLFSVRNLPVRGDIAGGAVVDPSANTPQFVNISVGTPTLRGGSPVGLAFSETGSVVRGVTVFLGTPVAMDRPVFHYAQPNSPQRFTEARPEPRPSAHGAALVDYARRTGFLSPEARVLELSGTSTTDEAALEPVPSFVLRAGLESEAERASALLAGVEVAQPLRFLETPFDRNADGMLSWSPSSTDPMANLDAHPTLVTVNPAVPSHRFPWVFPLVVLSRLHDPNAEESAAIASATTPPEVLARMASALNSPERARAPGVGAPEAVFPVVLFASVIPGDDPLTGLLSRRPPWTDPSARQLEDQLRIALPTVAFELHGPDPITDWVAIIPPLAPAALSVVSALLPAHYRCERQGLPSGRYSISLVAQTGQAWSTPNELAPYSLGASPYQSSSQGLMVRLTPNGSSLAGASCPTPPSR